MTAPKDPTARVVAEILRGDHDERFTEIAKAIQHRIEEGAVRICWRITLPDNGETWDRNTVTNGETAFVERATGVPWKDQDPRGSMTQLTAFVTAHHRANGDELETAIAKAEAITNDQALEMVDDYVQVNPPKASSEPPTS